MMLLEREPLLHQIHLLLAEAAAGRGSLVFVAGEAGVGKTTLVDAFSRSASSPVEILRGACDPLSTPRPLGPLVDIAGQAGGRLAQLLRDTTRRYEVFAAFLSLLTNRTGPALVIIEDAHWADEATLDLLRFAGRRVASTRALLLVTWRDDEVGPSHPLRVVLGDLATAPAVRRISVPPLSEDAVALLAGDSDIDPLALYRQTGGNPFFVTEVLSSGGHGIPGSVRDAVLARAARLPPHARAMLDAAAVIGSTIGAGLLTTVAAPDAGTIDACIAVAVLRPGVDDHSYAFRHELAREAILASISPHRRTELHRKVLDALRAEPPRPDDLARLAHHAEQAGDVRAVLTYAPAAARRAVSLHAHREAAAQYARALRVAPDLPPAERAELLEARARECQTIDRLDEAIAAWREAAAIWHSLGNRLREGAVRCELVSPLVNGGRNAEGAESVRAGMTILETLPPGPELARAYGLCAALHMLERDSAAAIAWGHRALELAERFHAAATMIGAYNAIGSAMIVSGNDDGVEYLEQSVALATEAGAESDSSHALSNLGSALGEMHQFARAESYLVRAFSWSTEHDLDFNLLYTQSWQALCQLHLGRWNQAARLASEVLSRQGIATITRIMALVALGRLRARRGDPDVWLALDEALTLALQTATLQRLAPARAARAEAAWLAGDPQRALVEARDVYELATERRHPWFVGELAYWRRQCADPLFDPRSLPAWVAEPFRLQAAGHALAAADRWRALECPYETARALAESDDQAALREALATFEQLGAQPMAAVVTRRLRDLGARGIPRGPRASTRESPAGLTRRETEVLRLLAEGLHNAEIAERLYLSPRTVERHVSALLAKLEVRTRTEATREAERLGLVPPPADDASGAQGWRWRRIARQWCRTVARNSGGECGDGSGSTDRRQRVRRARRHEHAPGRADRRQPHHRRGWRRAVRLRNGRGDHRRGRPDDPAGILE